jgi:hypothetical protein
MEKKLEILITLWPSFPHFERFARDERLSGIRLNSAMLKSASLEGEFEKANSIQNHVPLYFDIKGNQLRVMESFPYKDHLELEINHPIEVNTPVPVLFKAGADNALLEKVENNNRLIFSRSPEFMVYPGESLHIRDPSLIVQGKTFLDYEIEKIEKAKKAGFKRFFLSYVEGQRDINEFREFVGDSEIVAKIESKKGLSYVQNEFKKKDNLSLMAARGDLYVEIDKPHEMYDALKLIINKDPEGYVGSRILLSMIHNPVPECADMLDLAWLYDQGYRKMMLCDELCLKGESLDRAINVLGAFRDNYAGK